jgi:hypothetical protein
VALEKVLEGSGSIVKLELCMRKHRNEAESCVEK